MKTHFCHLKPGWIAILLIFVSSCNEDGNLPMEKSSPSQVSGNHLDARAELAGIAPYLYEKIDNRYETFGEIAYNQLKYSLAESPVDLLPEFKRAEFDKLYRQIEEDYSGLSFNEALLKAKQEKIMDEPAYLLTNKFFEDVAL